MPLPLPNLDTRRWNDLVDEGRALLPRFSPRWTDHNVHDPGITLLELMAWLTEMDVYRTNQIPDRHIRQFLSLVGYPPLPPRAASAVLTLTGTTPVSADTEFATADGIRFRTLRTITVSPASIGAVQSDDEHGTLRDRSGEFLDRIPFAFHKALYLGFSQITSAVPLTLYFWLREPGGGVVRLEWEAFTGGVDQWTAVTPSYDDTRSLILDGTVEVTLPATIVQAALGAVADPFFYLRCRIRDGSYDATPWIAHIEPNSVAAAQSVPAQYTTAVTGPQLLIPGAPAEQNSVEVFTGPQQWTRREDFDASHRTDFHFTLDAPTGLIRFGDGERGRTVVSGTVVQVNYRTTRAALGNVDAGSIIESTLPGVAVTNYARASGGAHEEDLKTAASRAVAVLYSHDARSPHPPTRAVNLEDYERLALSVPFTRVARAKAYSSLHPGYPCLRAPGVVTVVVVPDLQVRQPMPSPELLRAVFCWLDRRRMVGTQVHVTGPHYLQVRVRARVKLLTFADAVRVRAAIRAALDDFLDPLRWPFGRDVYRSEVLAAIDNVPGVDHVIDMTLSAGTGGERCGNLKLCPGWLAASGAHTIEVTKED